MFICRENALVNDIEFIAENLKKYILCSRNSLAEKILEKNALI